MIRLSLYILWVLSCAQSQVTEDPFECTGNQWRCKDGTCVPLSSKCDGTVHCADGSDETFVLCRENVCDSEQFRCAYGACVNTTAPCNQVKDCADNSDEALFRCLPETDRIRCLMVPQKHYDIAFSCESREFECENGIQLFESDRCDGKVDCSDGSDETIQRCTEHQCTGFRCGYGGCAHKNAMCNGVVDCADASDESDELCGRQPAVTEPSIPTTSTPSPPTTNCTLPPQPEHGSYLVSGHPYASPGDTFPYGYINVTCQMPYRPSGRNLVSCYNGKWSAKIPRCVMYCKLPPHPSVEYRCLLDGASRPCNMEEPAGTTVRPMCRKPNYYYPKFLSYMHCKENGKWDSLVTCVPECGRITPSGRQLVANGTLAARGELPWHAGIYRKKNMTAIDQICGGSIISTRIVISAAHCFWSNYSTVDHPSNYAVAVGKLYRAWANAKDVDVQKFDVTEIKVPVRFRGVETRFQDDIALVILASPIVYQTYIRPVCMDFDYEFDKRQLSHGNIGKVAGWGLTEENRASSVLKVAMMPVVNTTICLQLTPLHFREYVTPDKICVGYSNGTSVCKGDSGGGLAFPVSERGVTRHYLRGIVSTSPASDLDGFCNAHTIPTFTRIMKHEYFIQEVYGKY